jgi:tRNA A37 N6-isopentenylltransferase MiaA
MPYDTYDLLVKKLSKPKVWTLNVDELCEEINILYESEVQELKKEIEIERDYNIRFRNENRELKNELKSRISLETGNMLKQDLEDYKNMLNSRGKDVARLEKENQELKEYIQKLADKIEYDEDKELLKALESADERFKK